MNERPSRRHRRGNRQLHDPARPADPAPKGLEPPAFEHLARQRELTVRLVALLAGMFGAPTLTAVGLATNHPLVTIGSLASAAPLTVAKLIRPPES